MKIWYWCDSCEQCFPIDFPDETVTGDVYRVPAKCVYLDCKGTRDDFRVWSVLRQMVKSFYKVKYPEIPERFKVYPLNPDKSGWQIRDGHCLHSRKNQVTEERKEV